MGSALWSITIPCLWMGRGTTAAHDDAARATSHDAARPADDDDASGTAVDDDAFGTTSDYAASND